MSELNKSEEEKLIDSLNLITNEFNNLESYLEVDNEKGERFKKYLKTIYDFLKIQENGNDFGASTQQPTNPKVSKKSSTNSTSSTALPELIIDPKIVDLEQIYQQLQLYNNNSGDSYTSISTFAKFFSKCLLNVNELTFGIDKHGDSKSSSITNEDTEADVEEETEDEDVDDDDDDEDDDEEANSIDELVEFSKKSSSKSTKPTKTFGIPDGSDSEISDFEVGEGGGGDDDDDEDEEDVEDVEDDDEDGENELKKFDDGDDDDDEDEDEVDEDLVDMFENLGDEKEVMGIGKKSKAFEEVDFDREDFGFEDDEDDEKNDNDNVTGKKKNGVETNSKIKNYDLFDQDEDDEKEGDEPANKSSFEIRQEKLKERVDEIHGSMLKNLEEKPWQLKGEVTAKTRPQDSLMEEFLEFDHTNRQAPIIDSSFTDRLEKIIKQRIKDKAFDDVERKLKPVEMQYEYKKQVVLDQEKSKMGLGQVYEQEFLKQQQKLQSDADLNDTNVNKDILTNPKHEEIRRRLQSLFIKLDALSNFHFTPKAPMPEIKVVSNMPTINMEEVAPVNVADSSLLAPEEIKARISGLPKSKSEEDKKDKSRNLRTKKLISKRKKVEKEKKIAIAQAIDPNNVKLNKEVAMNKLKKQAKNMSKNIKILKNDKRDKSDKAYRSSSSFFKQLQENAQTNKSGVSAAKKIKHDSNENKKNAKKLKL